MARTIIIIFLMLGFCFPCYAQYEGSPFSDSLILKEYDGDPETYPFEIIVPNDMIEETGSDGSIYLDISGEVISTGSSSFLLLDGSNANQDINIGSENLVTTGTGSFDNLEIGGEASASFSGTGDIYASDSIKAMEGLYTESKSYGAGLEVLDNSAVTTYTNVMFGDATLTGATQIITDTHASFDDTYEEQFLRVISSTPSFTGATGEIIDVIDSTHLSLSFATAGEDTIVDATGMSFVIYSHPNFFVGDNGFISAQVGVNEDAKFEVHIPDGRGFNGVYIDDMAGANSHQALTIDASTGTYTGIIGADILISTDEAVSDVSVSTLALEIDENNYTDSHLGFINVALIGSGTDNDIDVLHLQGLAKTDHIIHAGESDIINRAYYDNGAGTTTDATTAFTSQGTDITIFENDNSIIYIGNTDSEYNFIGVSLSTEGNKDITAEYYYCTGDDTWVTLPGVTDTTNGFTTSGTITFPNPVDRGLCDEEIDSTAFADTTDRAYIAIKRTRNSYPGQKPIESLFSISGGGDLLYLDSYGLKPIGSAGAPYSCTASVAGMTYHDTISEALLWCTGSAWIEFAETADITVHNNLSGLQGGTSNEYYHLTSAEYSGLNIANWDTAYTHTTLTNNPHSVDETDILASQSGHSGKYLTTNGTTNSWGTLDLSSYLENIVEDTTPQLGGNLDGQSYNITTTGTGTFGKGIFDVTDTEALLVRKDGDSGDTFVVDTTNTRLGFNATPSHLYSVAVYSPQSTDPFDRTGGGFFMRAGKGYSISTNMGGTGGKFELEGGAGGTANWGLMIKTGGDGGILKLRGGVGGNAEGTGNLRGGNGGNLQLVGGNKGYGATTDGDGGDVEIVSGLGVTHGEIKLIIGDFAGTTILTGLSDGSGIQQDDNIKHYFGTGKDANIYYDGADLVIKPDVVGSGSVVFDNLKSTYTNGSAYVCVNNNGELYASESACP